MGLRPPSAGGVNPEDVGYDVFLLAGQSNMAGRGAAFDLTHFDPVDPRIKQFGDVGQAAYTRVISQAVPPLSHHDAPSPLPNGGLGPGIDFARAYLSRQPTNRSVLLVPCAHGGTGFAGSGSGAPYVWKTDHAPTSENLYENAISQATLALAAAGENSRLKGVLWHQGESDATLGGAAVTAYPANLDALIDGLRTRLGIADLPFVVGQMQPNGIAGDAQRALVNTVHIETPRRKTRAGFTYAPTGAANQNGDDTHFSAPGQRTLGANYFPAYERALLNVTGTPPVAPSSVTAIQVGSTLSVSWPQSEGRVTDYAVRYRVVGAGSWTNLTRAQSIDVTASITGITPGQSYEVAVAAVNEQGTSPYTQVTATTIVAPGQVTGLAAGAATTTQQALSWNAVATATSYQVEYKKASSGTWLTGPTSATTSVTVPGLEGATSYNYRVSAVNAAGPGPVSSTVTASTATPSTPIDDVGIAAARAYGLRKLRSAYAGSAIRVRRSGDNVEADIGFTAGGDLDTAALLAHVGANDGFIKTLYDQSGNALDITQATTTAQPRIVLAGTLDTQGGRPMMVFNGSSQYLEGGTPGMYAAGAASSLAVIKFTGGTGTGRLLNEGNGGAANGYYSPWFFSGSTGQTLAGTIINDAAASLFSGSAATTLGTTLVRQISHVDTGSAFSQWVAGAAVQNAVGYTRSGAVTTTRFGLGALLRSTVGAFWNGSLGEIVIWNSALTTTQRQAGESNQASYYSAS